MSELGAGKPVETEDGSYVMMRDLREGTSVCPGLGKGASTALYEFTHRVASATAKVFQLKTACGHSDVLEKVVRLTTSCVHCDVLLGESPCDGQCEG